MFPKYIFSNTRFYLIILSLILGTGTFYLLAQDQIRSFWMFSILLLLFSTGYWFILRCLGLIARIAKLEEIEHLLTSGIEIKMAPPTKWRDYANHDRTKIQKYAALTYYSALLQRLADLTFAIMLFTTGIIIITYPSVYIIVYIILLFSGNILLLCIFINIFMHFRLKKYK